MGNGRILEIPLISNGYTLTTSAERLGWLTPSDPAAPVKQLWEQFKEQGYLWLRGILDRADVLDFRRRFFTAFAQTGLVAPGSDPADGIAAWGPAVRSGPSDRSDPVDHQAARELLVEAVRWAAYEAFCLSRPIYRFYEEALGGPVYLHKRKILRYTRPGDPNCTGAHYDLTYLRAGTDRVYTSWIPIGDIPVEMGGLVYLEVSDAWGRKKEAEFSALNTHLPPEERISAYNRNMSDTGWLTKDLPSQTERLNTRWLGADYEAGDMVIHSAYMIHAATENRDPQGRLRLSTDIRYQLISDPIDARWTNDWRPDDEKHYSKE